MSFQTAHNARTVRVACGASRIDDDVDGGQLMLMVSKRFPDQSLEPVAANCIADDAGGNRQSEPRGRTAIGTNKNGKESIGKTSRILVDAIEIRFVMKTLRRSERPGECLQVGVLTVAAAPGERQTVSRTRPLARRRASTRRPDRVAMRARKPWVRARWILLGL